MALRSMPLDRRTLLGRGAVALVLSLILNWLILGVVLAADLVTPFQALSFPPVTILTTAGVVGAVIVYALVDRQYRNPNPIFVKIALAVLVLSWIPDIGILAFDEEATAGAVVVLMVMHVPPALLSIASLTGELPAPFE